MAKSQIQIIEDGHAANRILLDPDVVRIFDEMESDAVRDWKVSSEIGGREAAYHRVNAVNLVRQKLQSLVDNATIATKLKR